MKKILSLIFAVVMLSTVIAGFSFAEEANDDEFMAKIKETCETALSQSIPAAWEGPTETTGAPPAGIKTAGIPSDASLSGVVAPTYGMIEACDVLGWEFQSFDGGGDASSQNAAILSAISWGADVICCVSVDPRNVQQGLKAAQDAGVLICVTSCGIDDPNPVLELEEDQLNFAFDVSPNYFETGWAIGSWIINDAGNEGEIVVFCDDEFPSNTANDVGLMACLDESNMIHPETSVTFVGAQIGDTLNRQLISYLQAHPDCTYVFAPYDPCAVSMVEGLNQAAMTDIKLISILGIEQNLQLIKDGDIQCADGVYDNYYMGWAVVDQCIRLLNGKELSKPIGENVPYGLVDAEHLPEGMKNWRAKFDYASEFQKLWVD